MWSSERYTHRRGRSAVPDTLVRTRSWTRWRLRSLDNLRTGTDATVLLLRILVTQRPRRVGAAKKLSLGRASLGPGLAGLLLQALAGNANSLLLIGIGWPKRTDVRRHLSDLTLVRTADDQVRLLVHRDLDAFRDRKGNRVRLAEREGYSLALEFGAVPNADDVHFLFEARSHAVNGVGHQSASQPVNGAVLIGSALDVQHAILLFEGNAAGNGNAQLALGTLHFHFFRAEGDLYARRHWNWFVSDT